MKKEFYLKRGMKKIKCVHYPLNDPNAVIMIVHGLGEHIQRYDLFAREMRDHGFAVFGFDHFGHGESSKRKGHTSVEEMLGEIEIVFSKINLAYPNKKVGIFGHSMGGLVALREIEKKNNEYFAAVLSSPAVYVKKEDRERLDKMDKIIKFFPFITINNGLSTKMISRNVSIVDDYETDPNVHSKISLKLASSIYKNGLKGIEEIEDIKIPLLVQSGTGDEIVKHQKVKESFGNMKSEHKVFIPYEGAYHEIFFDPEHGEKFRTDVIGWFRRYS